MDPKYSDYFNKERNGRLTSHLSEDLIPTLHYIISDVGKYKNNHKKVWCLFSFPSAFFFLFILQTILYIYIGRL